MDSPATEEETPEECGIHIFDFFLSLFSPFPFEFFFCHPFVYISGASDQMSPSSVKIHINRSAYNL